MTTGKTIALTRWTFVGRVMSLLFNMLCRLFFLPRSKHFFFRMDLLAAQGTLKSLLQHPSSKASILWHSAFFVFQLSHPYMTTGKTIALKRWGKPVSLLETRRNFPEKGVEPIVWTASERFWGSSQGYGFPSGHVWMWELDCEEGWAPKNWCFWTVVLEKTLESLLDCREIQPVHSEGDQSWDFFGRNDAKAETPVLWTPHVKSWLIGKDSDAGRDWGQEEKGMMEDERAGWHHRLDGR